MEGDLLATELVGADLFATATTVDQSRFHIDSVPDEWEQVASIGDVVLGSDGQVRGVLVDVGGFLGIGSRTVAISMDQLEIQGNQDASDLRVYLAITEEQLEALPEHDAN